MKQSYLYYDIILLKLTLYTKLVSGIWQVANGDPEWDQIAEMSFYSYSGHYHKVALQKYIFMPD